MDNNCCNENLIITYDYENKTNENLFVECSKLIDDDNSLSLVFGSGMTAKDLLLPLVTKLKKINKNFIIFAIAPFSFEGMSKNNAFQGYINELKKLEIETIVISNQEMSEKVDKATKTEDLMGMIDEEILKHLI